ncbi:hypothetical protein ACFVAV_18365 [Nocardia sp. NPDC057663]|uniref:hypothetical protein n=1 Tax=Nocardia sp. NPDC057663 TaxID=3346201 RepID=UPI0036732354
MNSVRSAGPATDADPSPARLPATGTIPCEVEIIRHSRRDGDAIARWVQVIVNGIPVPATGEPRVVHTPLGTHVALDLTATSVTIRAEDGNTELEERL